MGTSGRRRPRGKEWRGRKGLPRGKEEGAEEVAGPSTEGAAEALSALASLLEATTCNATKTSGLLVSCHTVTYQSLQGLLQGIRGKAKMCPI